MQATWNKIKLILFGISVMSELLLSPEQRMGGWGSSMAINEIHPHGATDMLQARNLISV